MQDLISLTAMTRDPSSTLRLSDLLKGVVGQRILERHGNLAVSGVTQDSRQVKPGSIFVAIPGTDQDGHSYLADAAHRGAGVLIVEKTDPHLAVPQIQVKNPREVLAILASRYYGEPTRRLQVYGITGTNGKTTLTYLLESILKESGREPGVIGTINTRFADKVLPAPTTTPEPVSLQKIFREMEDEGVTDVVMEVSSHALTQERVRGIHFNSVAFTNLSRDHLDYHRDMEDYFAAKERLFIDYLPESAKKGKFSVINMEDPRGPSLYARCRERKIRTGMRKDYEVSGSCRFTDRGIGGKVRIDGKEYPLRSTLLGPFNLENILVAIGIAWGAGLPVRSILKGVEKTRAVPGRLEPIPSRKGFAVYVDYAHTPEALSRVGAVLKSLGRGRILTLFGCGGDRDRGKRPQMGREAGRFSDLVIVTSDNPRTEDPEKIIDAILPGLEGFPKEKILRIPDRREALKRAIEIARPGDTVLVAGKGHEDYQIIGHEKTPFSDSEILKGLLRCV